MIPLVKDAHGYRLPEDVSKSWKTLEQSCCQSITVLSDLFRQKHPKTPFICSAPLKPYQFGYSKGYRTEMKARSAISDSLDAFVLLFAHVSFCIAICRNSGDPASISSSSSTSTQPSWFQHLSRRQSKLHLEWLQLLADSPISDFTTTPKRVGSIINVSRCSWFDLVPYMLMAKVPIWFYWGIPPIFVQPLNTNALTYAPRSHPQSRAPLLPVITPSQSVGPPTPSQSVGPPIPSQSVVSPTPSLSVSHRSGQLPGETWKDFMTRQNIRRKTRLSKETDVERQAREDREYTAAKRSCPGKKGPTVFLWENENDVWKRTLVTRGQVEREWGRFRSSQMIYNSIDNCWDLCFEFDAGTAGELYEYDSNDDDDDDTYCTPAKQSRRSPTPKNVRSGDGSARPSIVVDSESTPDCTGTAMDVDPTHPQISSDSPSKLVKPSDPAPSTPTQVSSDPPPMILDPIPGPISSDPSMIVDVSDPAPQSVPTPAQVVVSDPAPMLIDSESLSRDPQTGDDYNGSDDSEDDRDPYDMSRQDVLNAYSFGALDLEQMPVTSLDDLLYYRYGFSLAETPYTGIPSSVSKGDTCFIRNWIEVCRIVGGQRLESSAVLDRSATTDFLSILAGSPDPFKDVPGKYWDLSPSGCRPIVDLDKVFVSIEERQFTNGKQYIVRPRFLHPSRDTPWLISVDSITALECIRRRLGPHTIDVANFLISHGVHFRTLQRILNSEEPPVRPHIRYLGIRPNNYIFDLADFAGYEELRNSFLLSQSHGPLALREGGIIARLAREVLPNINALSGPSSEALNGRGARFICGNEIYVDDTFSEVELGLLCGTYALGNPDPNARGGNEFTFFSSCY